MTWFANASAFDGAAILGADVPRTAFRIEGAGIADCPVGIQRISNWDSIVGVARLKTAHADAVDMTGFLDALASDLAIGVKRTCPSFRPENK